MLILQISLDMHHSIEKKRMSLALREATARCVTGKNFLFCLMHVRGFCNTCHLAARIDTTLEVLLQSMMSVDEVPTAEH